ncbi:MAG: hypothetical protein SWY16_13610 [Cyanobacteriota bacterium]|nr:hypothetical protein [Cyanobacteriota bacterium]
MNQSDKKRRGDRFRSTVAVTIALSTLFPTAASHAVLPSQAKVEEILGSYSELLIRRGNERDPIDIGSILQRFSDVLITSYPNNAYAIMRFLSADGRDLNMYVKTNGHTDSSIYYFPCEIQGGNYHIGWGLADGESRGCENGVEYSSGRSPEPQSWRPSPVLAEVLDKTPLQPIVQPLALKSLARSRNLRTYYCSAVGSNSNMGFATATSGDPCTEALQQCQAGGAGCETVTRGFWWTREEELQATLDCEDGQTLSAEGSGTTIESAVQTLLQESPGVSCSARVRKPQNFTIVPPPDEMVQAEGDDEILVQARETAEGLRVDVIEGAINVRSSNRPEPQLVTKGYGYIHTPAGGEVTDSETDENPTVSYIGEIVPFDRQAALTSIDMEVLCAFAANPDIALNIAPCYEAGLMPDEGEPPIAYCNREQASGGSQGDRRTLQMNLSKGEIKFEYEMYQVPDRVQIIYEGREILDTGFISGSDSLTIPYEGGSGRMEVILTGNESIGTRWDYTLRCP